METNRAGRRSWFLGLAPALLLASSPAWADGSAARDARADREALGRIQPVRSIDLCGRVPGHKRCMAKVVADATGAAIRRPLANGATPQGFAPSDLHSAYALPMSGGDGKIVAVIDAFDAPNAEADLGTYRAQFNLPPCTTANGCFQKVSQNGDTNYPPTDGQGTNGWEGEIMLDIEMISAVCPDCHILLVEVNDDTSNANFEAGLTTAAKLGASAISNSYGGSEDQSILDEEAYYNQPGILVTASAGDDGFGASYPATSAFVLAVGGTSLATSSSTRGWAETAWSFANNGATGSGCSAFIAKPSYQSDPDCSQRMESDVSAVADPATGVATYDQGWEVVGGTSASSPVVASAFVLLGLEKSGLDFPYKNPSAFFDITSGTNDPQGGTSCNNDYECVAGVGYDGPTGWGTPNGSALAQLVHPTPSTPDAGTSTAADDAGSPGSAPNGPVADDAGSSTSAGGGTSNGAGSTSSGSSGGTQGGTGNGASTSGNGSGTVVGSRDYYGGQLPGAQGACGCSVPGSPAPLGRLASLLALGAGGLVARRGTRFRPDRRP